ncbi:hypothetical protein QQF64_029558 [Cirrhinus molitorella]|uniref:Uncharacterized protein n=1 Tax=Cirrhinus molitorella TaxID=172907 RepID=A0ABR3N0U0_9TELE
MAALLNFCDCSPICHERRYFICAERVVYADALTHHFSADTAGELLTLCQEVDQLIMCPDAVVEDCRS